MNLRHTLLFRLVGPMQSWGYRSRFEDRDTGLEPTRSGVLGLLASASGIPRDDAGTLERWDASLRFGVRSDLPASGKIEQSGFLVETDFHTAQEVLRAAGKGIAETVLSRRHYLADARFTVGVESMDLALLRELEAALKDPVWTLSLGRKSFPLSVPPWLPGSGIRENVGLLEALKRAPWITLREREAPPSRITFTLEPDAAETIPAEAIPMRLNDRPLDFGTRRFGLRQVVLFQLDREACELEVEPCFSQR